MTTNDDTERWYVQKNGRFGTPPYAGPSCKYAGVEPDAYFATREEAQAAADALTRVNPVGFKVYSTNERVAAPRDAVAEARALLALYDTKYGGTFSVKAEALDRYALSVSPDMRLSEFAATLRALADECDALRAKLAAADDSHAALLNMYNVLHANWDAVRQLAHRQAARIEELEKHVPDAWRDWTQRITPRDDDTRSAGGGA